MNSKQRAYLRGLANKVTPIFQIGKGGVNDNFITQVVDALEAREIIKISVLENSLMSPKDAAEEIAVKSGSECIQVIGSKFVLYKESKEKPIIILP